MLHIVEGTWDEIKLHEAEFVGRHLRVIVEAEVESDRDLEIKTRLQAWSDFVALAVPGVVVDDSREGIYGNDLDRG